MTFLLIVTVSSIVLAAVMSAIAWRIATEERRRSSARVATLAAEIRAPAAASGRVMAASPSGGRRPEIGLRAEPARLTSFPAARPALRWDDDLQLRAVERAPGGPELFAANDTARSRPRLRLVAAIGVLGFVAAAAMMMMRGRVAAPPAARTAVTAERRSATASAVQPTAPAGRSSAPLELVALGHERDGDRLTVRGVVRNPASGATLEAVAAVVSAFAADGGLLASGRAIIESSALQPGGESAFIVTVPGAAAVARYRVSFRVDDRVVPHLDRREPSNVTS